VFRGYLNQIFVRPCRVLLYGNLRELSVDWWLILGLVLCVYTVPIALLCWAVEKLFFPHSTL
jgi:hypothetical protein